MIASTLLLLVTLTSGGSGSDAGTAPRAEPGARIVRSPSKKLKPTRRVRAPNVVAERGPSPLAGIASADEPPPAPSAPIMEAAPPPAIVSAARPPSLRMARDVPAPAAPPERRARVQSTLLLEAFGLGGLYSLNYELRHSSGLALRVGGSYMRMWTSGSDAAAADFEAVTVPVMASFAFGGREHKLALGLGATGLWFSGRARVYFATAVRSEVLAVATGFVGYRYVPREGGITAQVGFTPLAALDDSIRILPWAGLAVGWTI